MKICTDCGCEYENGICQNCGLLEEDYYEYDFTTPYPYNDESNSYSYGGARTHEISDISVMTKINKEEAYNSNLERVLDWDRNYGWSVVKTEIINSQIDKICRDLHIKSDFKERCFFFFRKIRDKIKLSGRSLEDIAVAIVYIVIRIDKLPYFFYDFEKSGYDISKIYTNYVYLVKSLNLYKLIKPHDPKLLIMKIINQIFSNNPNTYFYKHKFAYFIIRLFFGIFVKEEGSTFKGGGLPALAALIYSTLRRLPEKKVIQQYIVDLCGCTEVTLREHTKRLTKYFQIYEGLK